MDVFVAIGVVTTLLGLLGLGLCIMRANRARKMDDDQAAQASLKGLVALNVGSFAVSILGLMLVVFGLMLS